MGRLAEAKAVIWCWALALALVFIAASCGVVHASEIDIEKLANAIYKAENSKKHPYGILKKYKTTTPRQACINTIKSNLKRWNGKGDFILYLSRTYAPIGASNDPSGLNRYWVSNVKYHYELLTKG